jgi:HNH endonuclease
VTATAAFAVAPPPPKRYGYTSTTIVPRAQGGSHALENLLTVCDVCHPLVEREAGKRRHVTAEVIRH